MVSLKIVQESNNQIAKLPKGLVALFIGATSGIGQAALQTFARHASAPRIYTVSRPASATAHQDLLDSLHQSYPDGIYQLINADISLVSAVDKVVKFVSDRESKIDFLFLSAGFMAFEGRKDTSEGLDPSMTTRYYSRLRAVQELLPLLNNAAVSSPRVISVLAGGIEGPLNEKDLDLRDSTNWSFWNSSMHSTTMGTLALERIAAENPRLSIVHWFPGPVETPALVRAKKFGMAPGDYSMSQEESGERVVFMATSDRYAAHGSIIPLPEGVSVAEKSGGGIFLINPEGESTNNEKLLGDMRRRGVDKKVWDFTQKIFENYTVKAGDTKSE